jgi:hypothetical protein
MKSDLSMPFVFDARVPKNWWMPTEIVFGSNHLVISMNKTGLLFSTMKTERL